jgi:hypothetical protein
MSEKLTAAIRERKKLRRQVVNALGDDPGLHWVHGVLLDRHNAEHARLDPHALGLDGVQHPQHNPRTRTYSYKPRHQSGTNGPPRIGSRSGLRQNNRRYR